MPKRDSKNSGLNDDEIALIKAMLARGKEKGFTAQKILSYLSTPERTVNVARLYEIRDGKRGAEIISASDTQLDLFLASFHNSWKREGSRLPTLPWTPAPAYIGIVGERVALVPRVVAIDDSRVDLRKRLLEEQHRLATFLVKEWGRFQVDQRLQEHVELYADLASEEHSEVNIFSLDTEFRVINRSIGEDTGGLGTIGEQQWNSFCRNHAVLTNLYPEMRDYRAQLAALNPDASLAEDEARQAIVELCSPEGQRHVASEIPNLINERIAEDTGDDHAASRKRTYDVTSLLNTTGAYLAALIDLLPKVEQGSSAAIALWERYWPLLKAVLNKAGWS